MITFAVEMDALDNAFQCTAYTYTYTLSHWPANATNAFQLTITNVTVHLYQPTSLAENSKEPNYCLAHATGMK